jgi:hypothetical protein
VIGTDIADFGGFSAGKHLFATTFHATSPRSRAGSPQLKRDD